MKRISQEGPFNALIIKHHCSLQIKSVARIVLKLACLETRHALKIVSQDSTELDIALKTGTSAGNNRNESFLIISYSSLWFGFPSKACDYVSISEKKLDYLLVIYFQLVFTAEFGGRDQNFCCAN